MRNFFCSILLLITLNCVAQTTINGKVVDASTNQAIIGATILSMSDLSIGTSTDVQGDFSITVPEDVEQVNLLISYLGFRELQADFKPEEDQLIQLEAAAYQIEVVTISSINTVAEEFVYESFNKLEVYQNPSSRADPVRAVSSLPSSTNVDETANLSLRGSAPFETGYLLNEVPIHDAFRLDQSNGVGQFSVFNTSIISKVDVYPSNPPLEFGNASSGLVSIYTEDGKGVKSNAVNVTLAGMGLNISRPIGKNNSIVAYGNFSDDHGFKLLNAKAFEDIVDFTSFDAGLYTVLRPKDHTTIKFFNYLLKESYTFNFQHPSYDGNFNQNKIKNLSVLNLQRRFNFMTVDINHGFDYSRGKYHYGNIKNDIDETNYYGAINLTKFSDRWSIKLGSSWDLRNQKAQGLAPIYFFALAPDHPNIEYRQKDRVLNPESYIYGKYLIKDKWTLGGGMRYRKKETEELPRYLSAQTIMSYKPNPAHQLNVGLGSYHKLALPDGENSFTQIISSDHLSLDYHFEKEAFKLDFSVYGKNTSYLEQDNRIRGVELFAHWENSYLATSLSLSSIQSQVYNDHLIYDSKHDLSFFIRHISKVKLTSLWEIGSVMVFREGSYYLPVLGGKYHPETETYQPFFAEANQGERLDDYFTWDINTSRIFPLANGSLIAFLSASNVLNTKNERGELFSPEYDAIGSTYFNERVVFVGCVFNW